MKIIDLFALYVDSPSWRKLAPRSQELYMGGFRNMVELMDRDIKSIKRSEIIDILNRFQDCTSKGRFMIRVLSNLYRIAIDRDIVESNIVFGLFYYYKNHIPIEPWQEDEIDLFLSTAKPHLRSAMLLALHTGQRGSDLVRMTWRDYDGEFIHVHQAKTGTRLSIPVHPRLKADLDLRRDKPQRKGRKVPYLILNSIGGAWTFHTLRTGVMRHCRSIGLNDKQFHGIRKATASLLAEAGCSPMQIMAITGHKTLGMVQHYVDRANQKRLAKQALAAWENTYG